jgi:hypothetical protein
MLQHEKLKTLQQITGVVINFFQNNQNFTFVNIVHSVPQI